MADIVIDLSSSHFEEPAPRAEGDRRPWWRKAAITMAGVLALASLTAAQPAEPPALTLLATIDDPGGQGVVAIIDGLILRFGQGRLVAHELDGRLRWRSEARLAGGYGVSKVRDWYVVTGVAATAEHPTTVALDPATGTEVWRHEGRVLFAGDLLVPYGAESVPAPVTRIGSREPLWMVPPRLASGVDPARQLLYMVDKLNVLTERELATGKVLRTAKLSGDMRLLGFVATTEELVVLLTDRGPQGRVVFDRATFQVKHVPPGDPIFSFDCGPVKCLNDGLTSWSVVDKVTGEVLWSGQQTGALIPTAGGLLMDGGDDSSWLYDYRTGAGQVLAGWQRVDSLALEGGLMRRSSEDKQRTEFGVIVPGGVRHVATIPYVWPECLHAGDLLACKMPNQKIGVWRLGWPSARGDHRFGPPIFG